MPQNTNARMDSALAKEVVLIFIPIAQQASSGILQKWQLVSVRNSNLQ